MKRNILLLTLCLCATMLYGQSYWSLSGNSASSGNFIGTTNSQPLTFKTNNITRMTLSASQAFVGIGISTPNGNLHVHSSQRTPSSYTLTDFQMTNLNTGTTTSDGFRIRQQNQVVYINQLEKANLYLQNNSKGFVLDTNGYFGFNTTYPKQRVHVVDGNILISRTSACEPDDGDGMPNLTEIGERNLSGGRTDDGRTRCVPTDNGLVIYPNPTGGTLTVESASPIREITVYDLSGRVMMTAGRNGTASVETTHALSLRQDINVSSLPAGIYLLRVLTEKGVETGRFVKN